MSCASLKVSSGAGRVQRNHSAAVGSVVARQDMKLTKTEGERQREKDRAFANSISLRFAWMTLDDCAPLLQRWISCPVAMVLLNGAEPPVAMDVGAIGGAWGPDFAELGRQFLAHPKAWWGIGG